MKKFFLKFLFLIPFLGFIGCDNSLKTSSIGYINLTHPSEVFVYSGDTYFTRSVDVNINEWENNYQCENATKELSEQDIENIKELLSKGSETYNNVILPWPSYFVQQVYKGETEYDAINKHNEVISKVVGSDKMNKLQAYDGNMYSTTWDPETNSNIPFPYGHINNFNFGTNVNEASDNSHIHNGTTLMYNMPVTGFDANSQFGYEESWGTQPKFYNNYIIVEYKGDWYVGFDYEAHKNDQTSDNATEAYDINRDWNFTDWIVRISPAYPINYEGNLWEGDLNKDNKQPNNPKVSNHVEINLSIEERPNIEWLASHLSIHVRANTDVEVFIPIPMEYVCEADDLAIVQKHEKDLMVHGGPTIKTYEINGSTITLTLNTTVDGITIRTQGIQDSGVIDYLQKQYGDGLTFEIWNYFNITHSEWEEKTHTYLDLEELKDYLDDSTVKFTNLPDLYVNAFNDTKEESKFENDCIVKPENWNKDPEVGNWYNGSSWNELYYFNNN